MTLKNFFKKTLRKTLSALMITSLIATSSIANVQAPIESIDSMGRSAKTMTPPPMLLEEKPLKALSTLQEDQSDDAQKGARSLKGDLLGIVETGAKFAGKTALGLVTIDNTLIVVGIAGSAAFGPEVLMVTEQIRAINKALDQIEFVKDIKTRARQFALTAVEKGVIIAVTKTYSFVSKKVSRWFKKKK